MLLNSNATLTTIEKYEKSYNIAKDNFVRLGFSDRVTQILGDAKDVLQELASKNEKFDFVFLDGPKGQYLSYLRLAVLLLRMSKKTNVIFLCIILKMHLKLLCLMR